MLITQQINFSLNESTFQLGQQIYDHDSERYGASAVAVAVAAQVVAQFGLTYQFIDIDNPAGFRD